MKTFPIMLGGSGLRAVVVGGGPVGLRKARALLRAGAEVTLVDPRPFAETSGAGYSPLFPKRKKGTVPPRRPRFPSRLRVIFAPYRSRQLRGARLVMACTNDRELNHRIAADARAAGALVNVADQREDCDFFLPAVVADGDVVIAIGTGGLAPALAAGLKRGVAAVLPRRTGRFAQLLASLRREMKAALPDARRRHAIFRRLAQEDVFEEFLAGGKEAVLARVRQWTRPGVTGPPPAPQGSRGRLARAAARPQLLCVGASHKTAPLALRERLAMDEDACRKVLADLADRWKGGSFAAISTCNRTEIYCCPTDRGPSGADLCLWLADCRGVEAASLRRAAYTLRDAQAARHLFRLAAGMESLVPGEGQIVRQLKDAYAAAVQAGAADGVLNGLFQAALHVAKDARAGTAIAAGKVSVASVAVDCVAEHFPLLAGRTVLCVGAGRMAELLMTHLAERRPKELLVSNRSPAGARGLAARCGGTAVPFGRLQGAIARCDVLLTATASRTPIVTAAMVRRATAGRRRPLLIVDIAVPRNVEESVRGLPGVLLHNVDDLGAVVRRTLRGRSRQRQRVRRIVEDHLEEFLEGLAVRRIGPVIDALYRRMQTVTEEELAEARRKLSAHADAAEDELVLQRALHRSARRFLHPAAVNLRRLAASDSAHLHIQSIRHLFDLKD